MNPRRVRARDAATMVLLAALAMRAEAVPAASVREALAAHGIAYGGKAPYRVTLDRSLSEGGSRRLTAELGAKRLRASSEPARDARTAGRLLAEWKTRLFGQFEGEMSYPGMLTRRFEVPDALRPRAVPVAGGERSVWIVPATERLTFGAGTVDLVRYIAVVTHRWCPQAGRAAELTLFYPRESFREKTALSDASEFTCARSTGSPR